jgi:hypothetical protein
MLGRHGETSRLFITSTNRTEVFTYPPQKVGEADFFLNARAHHQDMPAFISASILALVWLVPAATSAQGYPAFSHALSDEALTMNASGQGVTLVLAADNATRSADVMGKSFLLQNILGIRAFADDTGTASVTQAATSLSLRATLGSAAGMLRALDP